MELLIIVAQSQTTFKYHWCQLGDETIFALTKIGDKSSEQSTVTAVFKIVSCSGGLPIVSTKSFNIAGNTGNITITVTGNFN